jgi:hypothetical protein
MSFNCRGHHKNQKKELTWLPTGKAESVLEFDGNCEQTDRSRCVAAGGGHGEEMSQGFVGVKRRSMLQRVGSGRDGMYKPVAVGAQGLAPFSSLAAAGTPSRPFSTAAYAAELFPERAAHDFPLPGKDERTSAAAIRRWRRG